MVLHWRMGEFMKETLIILIASICVSYTASAQSNRFWGSAHAVARANCVGTNESVTWVSDEILRDTYEILEETHRRN